MIGVDKIGQMRARQLHRFVKAVAKRRFDNRSEGQRLRKLLRFETDLWAAGIVRVAGVVMGAGKLEDRRSVGFNCRRRADLG